MNYMVTRLTIYALLSSIEQDLRQLIVTHLLPQINSKELLSKTVYDKCHKRYIKDSESCFSEPTPELLINYADFQEQVEILNSNKKYLPEDISKYLVEITPHLSALTPIRNRVAHVRPLNYDDFSITFDTSELLLKNKTFWNILCDTFYKLHDDSSYVLGLSIPAYESEEKKNHNLPSPDFDETGFIGRQKYITDLTKKCLGPYPVITVVGEGGIGKTALALKAAYEILDMSSCPFDAIVWTSSKTTTITPNEIIKIQGAISNSLGIMQNVAQYLTGNLSSDPFNEILEFMNEFKILLILDNLETIIDDRIRNFLEKLPSGSKILVTSRIGLGAFEIPLKLPSFDTNESIQLLRALSKTRNTNDLVSMSNTSLAKYCEKLNNNPGFIKWFVSSVQAGKRPEEVIYKTNLFLDFCMSNVYNYLSETSREVLKSLLCVKGKRSQAELAFLTQITIIELQKALQQLLSTNMIVMHSIPVGSSFESHYELWFIRLMRTWFREQHIFSV